MKNADLRVSRDQLERELEELRFQLTEANETIEAIRTGQVDAIVVQGNNRHQLYTLKSADQTYRFFIEKMAEGAVTLNREGLVIYCNNRFASLVGRTLSNVISSPFFQFIAPDDKARFERIFENCWEVDCKGEFSIKSGDTVVPVQLSLTAIDVEEGKCLSIIVTDLSEQKRAQRHLELNNEKLALVNKALELSNQDLQQFASVASHDLQEPLRKIRIFSNLLSEENNQLTPTARNYLGKIIDSSKRMQTLIVDILNYSRLSVLPKGFELVDLNELLQELREDFELVINEKNAELNIGTLPVIEFNRGQARQVFQNIIGNALKFSRKDVVPIITITAERLAHKSFYSEIKEDGEYCMISVRDNGIGFSSEFVNNIFALFERLHSKDSYEGTGIGLAITKKIIEKYNGEILAMGEEGVGADFRIILPIRQARP